MTSAKPKPKRKVGRPTVFRPDFVERARILADQGLTDLEIADNIGVSLVTLKTWKGKHPEFLSALKVGKGIADDRVERSLHERAIGYSYPSVKIHVLRDGSVVKVPFTEHVPPDSAAANFWLKNRRPDAWRDKHEVEITGDIGARLDRAKQRDPGDTGSTD